MQHLKTVGLAALVAVTVLGAGYLWGARGRWAAEERLAASSREAAFSEIRRLTLTGQVALTRLNFGEASGTFDSARARAEAAARDLEQDALLELAAEARRAAEALAEARALSGRLDHGAFGKAGEAIAILDQAAGRLPAPAR